MSSSPDEFFDAESEITSTPTNVEFIPQKPPRPPPPNLNRQKSLNRPSTLPLNYRSGECLPFFQLETEDGGLMTPNSTIDSITAEYTKEMMILQDRGRFRPNYIYDLFWKKTKLSDFFKFFNIKNKEFQIYYFLSGILKMKLYI